MSAFSIKRTLELIVLNVCFPAKADIHNPKIIDSIPIRLTIINLVFYAPHLILVVNALHEQ